jgi:DNA-directed RNA polymerase sigma subunit (sigma70/sigma32)
VAEDGTRFELAERLDEILGCLDPEEQFVIRESFSLNGQEGMTQDDMAKALGRPKRYIYVLKKTALEKLTKALGPDKERYLGMLPD